MTKSAGGSARGMLPRHEAPAGLGRLKQNSLHLLSADELELLRGQPVVPLPLAHPLVAECLLPFFDYPLPIVRVIREIALDTCLTIPPTRTNTRSQRS